MDGSTIFATRVAHRGKHLLHAGFPEQRLVVFDQKLAELEIEVRHVGADAVYVGRNFVDGGHSVTCDEFMNDGPHYAATLRLRFSAGQKRRVSQELRSGPESRTSHRFEGTLMSIGVLAMVGLSPERAAALTAAGYAVREGKK